MLLIKYYYHKVFRRTTMTKQMKHLKEKEIQKTGKQAKGLHEDGKLTLSNEIRTLKKLGGVVHTRNTLGLSEKRLRVMDIIFFSLLVIHGLSMLALLIGASYLPSETSFLNAFKAYDPETLYLEVALNVAVFIAAIHFTRGGKELLFSKLVLIVIGIYTFPTGAFSIIIGALLNEDLNASRKDVFASLGGEIKTNWGTQKRRNAFMFLVLISLVLFTVSLMRTTVVVADYHHVSFAKVEEELDAVSYTGTFRFEALDSSTTKVNVADMNPNVHFTHFVEPDDVYFNYKINDTWAFDNPVAFFNLSDNHRIENSFEIDESLEAIVESIEIEFQFTEATMKTKKQS